MKELPPQKLEEKCPLCMFHRGKMEYLYSFIKLFGGHFLVSIFHINSYVPMFIKTYIASKLDVKVNSGFIDCSYAGGTMFSEKDSVIGVCVCVCVNTHINVHMQVLNGFGFYFEGSFSITVYS